MRTLGASPDCCDAVALAVTEAATNAILYAYLPPREGQVSLRIAAPQQGEVAITISDTGVGLGQTQTPGGLGKGLLLIKHFTATLRVTSSPGHGTTVRMTFLLD